MSSREQTLAEVPPEVGSRAEPPASTPPGAGLTVAVREMLEHPDLKGRFVLQAGAAGLSRQIHYPRVQKSGLVLVGHTQGVVTSRVQVLGETEVSYLESLDVATRSERIAFLCRSRLLGHRRDARGCAAARAGGARRT